MQSDNDALLSQIEQEKQALEEQSAQQKVTLSKLQEGKEERGKTQADYDDILNQIEQEKQDLSKYEKNKKYYSSRKRKID